MFDTPLAIRPPSTLDRVGTRPKVLVLFGTRPEAIKLAPVIHELKRAGFPMVVTSSSQHKHLLKPFLDALKVTVDVDLNVMKRDQTLNDISSRVMSKVDRVLAAEAPDLVLVQGDTTTALAGALASFNRRIKVGHVEAGLRSGDLMSPFPEEMNRRSISQMASLHFAATEDNKFNLLHEGVAAEKVFVTGNTVVDSLKWMLRNLQVSREITEVLACTQNTRRILLTTHRRESFGEAMTSNLRDIASFVAEHDDVSVLFPVHPNPNVRLAARGLLGASERVHLLDPLGYSDFLALMKAAWMIVSDSGGVQEEAPTLGKPLLVLRENTERPEAIRSGIAKLAVGNLKSLLEDNYLDPSWTRSVREIANPFGDGTAARNIVRVIDEKLGARANALAGVQV